MSISVIRNLLMKTSVKLESRHLLSTYHFQCKTAREIVHGLDHIQGNRVFDSTYKFVRGFTRKKHMWINVDDLLQRNSRCMVLGAS